MAPWCIWPVLKLWHRKDNLRTKEQTAYMPVHWRWFWLRVVEVFAHSCDRIHRYCLSFVDVQSFGWCWASSCSFWRLTFRLGLSMSTVDSPKQMEASRLSSYCPPKSLKAPSLCSCFAQDLLSIQPQEVVALLRDANLHALGIVELIQILSRFSLIHSWSLAQQAGNTIYFHVAQSVLI